MNGSAEPYIGSVVTVPAADEALARDLEERLRESAPLAFRVAYGVLRHREDAEDVAQDAIVKACARIGQLRERDSFKSWLVRTTWRSAIDRWRSNRRRALREETLVDPGRLPSAEDVVTTRERSAQLWTAIDALPEKLRLVVTLGAIQGYDIREVATLLGLPEGTIKSRLFLARKRLAESLRCLTNDSNRR
jgi:RNA polymerase sigma-70 factor, ECF subfamily